MVARFQLQAIVMSSELEELILIKNLEMARLIFVHSAVQQVSSWVITSYLHSLMISHMLSSTQVPTTFYTMPAMKILHGISSGLVEIVKVTLLTMSLFRQFQFKRNPTLNTLIRRVNDMLRDLCVINGFGSICNDMITTKYLWKDGVHLQDLGISILSKNFIEFVNNYLFSNSHNRF